MKPSWEFGSRMSSLAALFAIAVTWATPALSAAEPVATPAAGGNIFVANRASGTISVISVHADEVVATLDMPPGDMPGEPMYVFYSPVGRRVFVGDRANDRVVSFDARTFEVDGVAPAGAGVFHMWGHTGAKQLWVNNDIDNTTTVVDTRTLAQVATVPTPADLVALGGKPHDVIVGPQGRFAYVTVIAVAGPEDYVVQFDTSTFEEVARAPVGDDPHVSLTPRTDFLYLPCQGANAVHVLDRQTLGPIAVLDVPGAHGAAMTVGGKYFYTTNLPGGGTDALFTLDTGSLTVVGAPPDAPYPVPHNVVLTPNGRKLYLTHSGANDKVTVWATSAVDPVPQLLGEITVGSNPFGLDYAP